MRLFAAIALVGLVAVTGVVHDRALRRRAEFPADQDLLHLPPPRRLEQMALGYREALADLVWIRALIFTGETLTQETDTFSDRFAEAINHLAPRFRRPYVWGGITAVYSGRKRIDRSMVERAIVIYRRGLARFPEDPQLLYSLGMLLTHQVPATPGYSEQERVALRREGFEYVRKAAAFGADPLVRQYAATLAGEHMTTALAVQFLETQLLQADDERHRRMIRKRLDELVGEDTRAGLERLRADFLHERDARAPYVPEALWAVLRSSPGPFAAGERPAITSRP